MTLIQKLEKYKGNNLYIKREDFFPFCFGGNKARKAELFFKVVDSGSYDCVVTYGSSHSNHCRVVANMAAGRGLRCIIISPKEVSEPTFNSCMMDLFGAEIIIVSVEEVHDTIENILGELSCSGYKPYFIEGGGHGNIGTEAYIQCYEEICNFEQEQDVKFDYIFLASGTGTTQAGLVCGQVIRGDVRTIVGISIARKNPRGRNIVIESEQLYLKTNNFFYTVDELSDKTVFVDDYIGEGYGKESEAIKGIIRRMLNQYGLPLDITYTAKAFWGMEKYLKEYEILNKNILFIHTGGTPLFFDDLEKIITSDFTVKAAT